MQQAASAAGAQSHMTAVAAEVHHDYRAAGKQVRAEERMEYVQAGSSGTCWNILEIVWYARHWLVSGGLCGERSNQLQRDMSLWITCVVALFS